MIRTLTGASTLAISLAGAAAGQEGHDDEGHVTFYRLFVGDHTEARVTAIGLSEPDHRWTFDTTGQLKL